MYRALRETELAWPAPACRPSWLRESLWRLRTDHVGLLLFICAVAISIPALVAVIGLDPGGGRHAASAMPGETEAALPPGAVPSPQPLEFLPIPVTQAVAINAAQPFVAAGTAARPFLFAGSAADHDAAVACLAAAVLYEAGDDRTGQQAVAQVVLNRMRHPAFPKSVCGVVFQGSERATGCQFTFTCDGALNRRMPAAAWARAAGVAEAALGGFVYAGVGLATHYHTNWVVPKWSATLDKIAQVGTHLFFRLKGAPGTPAAFTGVYAGREMLDPRLQPGGTPAAAEGVPVIAAAALDMPVVQPGPDALPAAAAPAPVNLRGAAIRLANAASGTFVLSLPPGGFSGGHALTAHELCRGRTRCTVLGYLDSAPAKLPLPPGAAARAVFYYDGSADRAYWNCARIHRPSPAECIPGTVPSALADSAPRLQAAPM